MAGATIGSRVRKNAKHLTAEEWKRFIAALKAIKSRSRPGGVVSIYDEFTALHMGAVELHRTWRRQHQKVSRNDVGWADPAHDNPGFLPWHRQLLLEFEAALQAVDPSVTLPYWDWTDREFNKVLFSPAYMGGNGGHDGKGGAMVNGPFTLDQGWMIETALHRPAWFVRDPNNPGGSLKDPVTGEWKVQASLGRSIVRYLGDFEDLATTTDVIEFTKRKALFGPEKLVMRSDMIPQNPGPANPSPNTHLPNGTIYIGRELPPHLYPTQLVSEASVTSTGSSTVDSGGASQTTANKPLVWDSDRAFREDVHGFRWALEASPHMHNQTHDWFGFYTTILQDDAINGASTMPNVACSTADPMFFMHHCNIDRLWAEWQDSGHFGPIFYPKREDRLYLYETASSKEPIRRYHYPDGHNLDDQMWPWDNNKMQTEEDIQSYLPQFSYILTPRDMLDYRSLGYAYDTSTALSVNSVAPVVVHLPAEEGEITYQVFPLYIQRKAKYLVSAWNAGKHPADLKIMLYEGYEEQSEVDFVKNGFLGPNKAPDEVKEIGTEGRHDSVNIVWTLPRGTYWVVVRAQIRPVPLLPGQDIQPIESEYKIAVATEAPPGPPKVPIQPGVITNPQVPTESAVYIPVHRYAPVKLEEGVVQWRYTQIKGTHELFGINVKRESGFADIKFNGMDALVQLYGPFDLDNDSLPHFDDDGKPIKDDNLTRLSSQLQIASSEGCCKRLGSGISSLVTPGRYVLLIFHCSIGPNENQPYNIEYTLDTKQPVPTLPLARAAVWTPPFGASRSVNLLYKVGNEDDQKWFTKDGDVYRVNVYTDDPRTQT
ncbi:hypothetical protein AX16_010423 [Volvariella volvacea WC 439]|nr:hypothetical protein AX16_010423 [Volvariella volvacea WC 439]